MLCGRRRHRCPIWCLMVDEMERGFCNAGLFSSLFGQFINLTVTNNVCVGSNFVDGNIVVGGFSCIYYLGYEDLMWMVVLGGWVSYVVEEKIFVIEVVYGKGLVERGRGGLGCVPCFGDFDVNSICMGGGCGGVGGASGEECCSGQRICYPLRAFLKDLDRSESTRPRRKPLPD